MDYCKKCGAELTKDEIGLYKKLCGKMLTEFKCINCTAEYFEVSPELLREKIEHYRSIGCTLFN